MYARCECPMDKPIFDDESQMCMPMTECPTKTPPMPTCEGTKHLVFKLWLELPVGCITISVENSWAVSVVENVNFSLISNNIGVFEYQLNIL